MASVSYAPAVLANLRTWGERAVQVGYRDEFVAALREMEDRLQHAPLSWGDPQWNFRSLNLTYYQRTGAVLLVRYVARVDGSHVFVRDVQLTPGSLLADLLG